MRSQVGGKRPLFGGKSDVGGDVDGQQWESGCEDIEGVFLSWRGVVEGCQVLKIRFATGNPNQKDIIIRNEWPIKPGRVKR